MRSASPKAARVRRERAATVKRTTHGPVRCQFPRGCTNEAVDWDERLTRGRGGSPTDRDNAIMLCRRHHDWKHANPAAARLLGIMPSAGDDHALTMSDIVTVPATEQLDVRVTLRVRPSGDNYVQKLATEYGVRPSVVWRAVFRVGAAHDREVRAYLTPIQGGADV